LAIPVSDFVRLIDESGSAMPAKLTNMAEQDWEITLEVFDCGAVGARRT